MTVESLRTVRDHLSGFVDRTERDHGRVVVTRGTEAEVARGEVTDAVATNVRSTTPCRSVRGCAGCSEIPTARRQPGTYIYAAVRSTAASTRR